MECVILAGGLGTRMRPVTEKIPKAMIAVADRPFVDHQLTWLAQVGVTRVVFCIGYRGAVLRDHVGDGAQFGVSVQYVDEGADPGARVARSGWRSMRARSRKRSWCSTGIHIFPLTSARSGKRSMRRGAQL